MPSVATVPPSPSSATSCHAVAPPPKPLVTHRNERPASTAVTRHTIVGSFGWTTRARFPTASGPPSSRRTLVTVGVHSCQRSTSDITAHTAAGGAAMAIVRVVVIDARASDPTRDPREHLAVPEYGVPRLQHPVVLVGEVDEARGDVAGLEDRVAEEALRAGDAVVLVAVDDEHRRLVRARRADGVPAVEDLLTVPRLAAERLVAALRDVARVLAPRVEDARVVDEALEAVRVPRDPRDHVAAVGS